MVLTINSIYSHGNEEGGVEHERTDFLLLTLFQAIQSYVERGNWNAQLL